MMMGKYKFGLTGARCLILCAESALIGCAIYLFSVSQVEAALEQSWFPFAQIQALTAGIDGETPESVCLVLAALPVFGFIAQLLRHKFKPEDLLLLLSAVLAAAEVLLVRSSSGALSSVSFPVSALIYCFSVLLGAKLISAHKRLRDENEMFI